MSKPGKAKVKVKRGRRLSVNQKHFVDAVYLDFLIWECQSFIWIIDDLHRLFRLRPEDYRVPATDIACAIAFAGNIAKMVWGRPRGDERAVTLARARRLRKRLGVAKDRVLNNTAVRNDFEHLDSRLDKWVQTNERLRISLFIQGPRDHVPGFRADEQFLQCDPATGEVMMLDHSLNLYALEARVRDLIMRAERARNAIRLPRPVVW